MKKVSEYLNTRCAFNDSVADTLNDIENSYAKSVNNAVLNYMKHNMLEEASLLIFQSVKFDKRVCKEGADLLLKSLKSTSYNILNLQVLTELLEIVTSSEDSEDFYYVESPDFYELFTRPMDDF